MANDLLSFAVWTYVWKFVFIALLLLIAIVVAYPWLLLIPLGIWWLCWKHGSDFDATEESGVATPGDASATWLHPAKKNPA